MKILFDVLPILLFLVSLELASSDRAAVAERLSDLLGLAVAGGRVEPAQAPAMLATAVVLVTALGQLLWTAWRGRRPGALWSIGLVLASVVGGATLGFPDESYARWKPSALYWLLGLVLWLGPLLTGRNLLKRLLGDEIALPDRLWHRLNFAWVAFFGIMGLMNLWVAYSVSAEAWLEFKLVGGVGLTLLFTLAQALVLGRRLRAAPAAPESGT